MPPKTTPSRKKRAAPKSEAATQFLRDYLKDGPQPAKEVQQAAIESEVSLHMLIALSQKLVIKKQKMGIDGLRKSYWSLRTATSRARKSQAAAREESIAFKSGYEKAISDMRWRLLSIDKANGEIGNKMTAKGVIEKLRYGLQVLSKKKS